MRVPLPALLVLIVGAVGVVLAVLVLFTRPDRPTIAAAPPPMAHPPAITAQAALTFQDPAHAPLLEEIEGALAAIRAGIANAPKDPKLTTARNRCRDIAPKLSEVAGEPHPRVRAAVDGVRRACECDVPRAALSAALDQMPKPPQKPAKAACISAVAYVDELRNNKYQDDPEVRTVLARFGAICAT